MSRISGGGLRFMTLQKGKLFTWLVGVLCLGFVVSLLVRLCIQFIIPPAPPRLLFVEDIPLPGALPDAYRTQQNPTAPGLATLFDHFDFQALDPNTHLLYIAHTGPSPDREQQVNPAFNPAADAGTDGNIVVFDTTRNKVVHVLNIPQVAGIIVATDLRKVYAADANDNIIYSIDEQTLKATPIQLQDNDGPDSLEYDQSDHLIFVSNPGSPAHPDQSQVIERKNQK